MKSYVVDIIHKDQTILTISKAELKSLYVESLDRGNVDNTIDFGVYSNKANISFTDKNKVFFNYVNNISDATSKTIKVIIYFNDTDISLHKKIGTFFVDSYNYDKETKEISINLVDGLEQIQQSAQKIEDYKFNESDLAGLCGSFLRSYADNILKDTEEFVTSLDGNIYCPHIVADNAWAGFADICVAGLARGFLNAEGKVTASRDEPTRTQVFTPKTLPPNKILNIDNEFPQSKTKHEYIVFSAKNREKKINEILGKRHTFEWFRTPANAQGFDWSGVGEIYTQLYNTPTSAIASASGEVDVPKTTRRVNSRCEIEGYLVEYIGKPVYTAFTTGEADGITAVHRDFASRSATFDRSNSKVTLKFSQSGNDLVADKYGRISNGYVWAIGDYYVDAINDEEYSLGEGSETTIFPTSDLVQTLNTSTVNPNMPMIKEHMEYFRRRYLGGIDCCEIECICDDYSRGDIIIPYVISSGIKQPYKTNKYGDAEKFIVIGIKYHYNGHPTQTLLLQEYKPYTLSGSWILNETLEILSARAIEFEENTCTFDFVAYNGNVYTADVYGIYFEGDRIVITSHQNAVSSLYDMIYVDGKWKYGDYGLNDIYGEAPEYLNTSLDFGYFGEKATLVDFDFYQWIMKNAKLD